MQTLFATECVAIYLLLVYDVKSANYESLLIAQSNINGQTVLFFIFLGFLLFIAENKSIKSGFFRRWILFAITTVLGQRKMKLRGVEMSNPRMTHIWESLFAPIKCIRWAACVIIVFNLIAIVVDFFEYVLVIERAKKLTLVCHSIWKSSWIVKMHPRVGEITPFSGKYSKKIRQFILWN